jgi:hypothetical protein
MAGMFGPILAHARAASGECCKRFTRSAIRMPFVGLRNSDESLRKINSTVNVSYDGDAIQKIERPVKADGR